MEDWKILCFTAGLSLLSSIIVGFISANSSHKNDIKKAIHAKRAEAYFDFYEMVEELLSDQEKVFCDEYFQRLIASKAKIKLMASVETITAFESFFYFIREKNREYHRYCDENNPYNDESKFITVDLDDNGEKIEECLVSGEDEETFEYQKKQYIEDYTPSISVIRSYINPLYEAMRKDLGSKL